MSNLSAQQRIRAETSPSDPHSMRFVLDKDVQDGALATFADATAAQGAPLAEALFAIPGVKMVDVAGAIVAVVKTDESDWETLKHAIAAALRSSVEKFHAPLGQRIKGLGLTRTDGDIRLAVQSVLDKHANPAIASHGGHVSVKDVQDGVVSMLMSGGCQGCASSAATLRGGVEKMIRAAVPEVRDIIDITDHAAGKTPYYSAGPNDKRQPKSPLIYRPIPADAIIREGDQFLISPDYIAARLGMDADTLMAGLRSGEIISQSEVGTGTHSGKTRLTISSNDRVWASETAADGTAHEIPAPHPSEKDAAIGNALRDKIRTHLFSLSPKNLPLTYGQLANDMGLLIPGSMGLPLPGSIAKVTRALEAIMVEDAEKDAPFLASLVVSKIGNGTPAKGFFQRARALGRGPGIGEDDGDYYLREFTGAVAMVTT